MPKLSINYIIIDIILIHYKELIPEANKTTMNLIKLNMDNDLFTYWCLV